MAEVRPSSGETPAPRLIAFEDYRFDPGTGELWHGDREIKLPPRSASLLAVLTEHATQVVTKQELIKQIWDGKAIGDDALTSCVQELRRALGDDPRRPRFLETRHRRGYRLLVPVTRVAIRESSMERGPTLPERPSIAVLRFQNMSDDEGQQYFVDGVVDDIITALSRFHTLFVISRNSSFAYSGRVVDMKQVGRELGVRYVLAGSVRKAANRLRVTAQLVDATTGTHMWGDRLEGALEAVFDFQDQITEKVVAAIAPKLLEAEIVRVGQKPAGNLDAYDFHLRGFALVYPATKDGIVEALGLFRRAIELDPNYPAPYGAAILTYGIRRGHGWAEDPEKDKAEVTRLLQSAVRVGREDALVLGETAFAAAYVLQDLPFAKSLMDQALDLNVNLARIWGCSGWINLWAGDLDRSVDHFRRASRLDPHTTVYTRNLRDAMAHAYFFLGKYDEAVSLVERELPGNPNSHGALRIGAASAAYAGNSEVAQRLGKHLQSIDPAFRVSRLNFYLGPYQKPEFVAKYADGLRKAGLPE